MAKAHIPTKLRLPAEMGGTPDANIIGLVGLASDLGSDIETNVDKGVTTYEIDDRMLALTTAELVFQGGGDVEDYPMLIEITAITDPVTDGLPNRVITAEDGTETVKTWEQWGGIVEKYASYDAQGVGVGVPTLYVEANDGQNNYKYSEVQIEKDNLVREVDLRDKTADEIFLKEK